MISGNQFSPDACYDPPRRDSQAPHDVYCHHVGLIFETMYDAVSGVLGPQKILVWDYVLRRAGK